MAGGARISAAEQTITNCIFAPSCILFIPHLTLLKCSVSTSEQMQASNAKIGCLAGLVCRPRCESGEQSTLKKPAPQRVAHSACRRNHTSSTQMEHYSSPCFNLEYPRRSKSGKCAACSAGSSWCTLLPYTKPDVYHCALVIVL